MPDDVKGERWLNQTAVYWAKVENDRFGKPKPTDEPIEIACRWDDEVVQFLDVKGRTLTSNAIVIVDRDLTLGGVLALGTLADVIDPAYPYKEGNPRAYEIKKFAKTPDRMAGKFFREAYL